MATRRGDTLIFPKPPVIAAHACIGGKKEGESPLAAEFDELHSFLEKYDEKEEM